MGNKKKGSLGISARDELRALRLIASNFERRQKKCDQPVPNGDVPVPLIVKLIELRNEAHSEEKKSPEKVASSVELAKPSDEAHCQTNEQKWRPAVAEMGNQIAPVVGKIVLAIGLVVKAAVEHIEKTVPPSPGYEGLSRDQKKGFPPLTRYLAHLSKRRGHRLADESKRMVDFVETIRAIAKDNNRKPKTRLSDVRVLLRVVRETSFSVERLFGSDEAKRLQLITLLEEIEENKDLAKYPDLVELARWLIPRFPKKPGRKISAEHAAHELMLPYWDSLGVKTKPVYNNALERCTDALSTAAQHEFWKKFDPRRDYDRFMKAKARENSSKNSGD